MWLAGLNIDWDCLCHNVSWAHVTGWNFNHFSHAPDSPLHSPNGREMPAVGVVQGDCETVYRPGETYRNSMEIWHDANFPYIYMLFSNKSNLQPLMLQYHWNGNIISFRFEPCTTPWKYSKRIVIQWMKYISCQNNNVAFIPYLHGWFVNSVISWPCNSAADYDMPRNPSMDK